MNGEHRLEKLYVGAKKLESASSWNIGLLGRVNSNEAS